MKEVRTMQLFNVLQPSMFSLLTSKNREIYVSSLFVLRKVFLQEFNIEKDKLIATVASSIEKNNYELMDSENETIDKNLVKDPKSTSSYIIKRFEETGWIECEYNRTAKFKENVMLPPYSVKLLNTLYEIANEHDSPYTIHLYNIYSNLFSADVDKPEYRFIALSNSIDELHSLENTLKLLNHDLRRRYRLISSYTAANDILVEHFDDYQVKVVEQIFIPLKTKDSVSRFKGNIWNILIKWLRSPTIMSELGKQAFYSGQFASQDEALSACFNKINYVIQKLDDAENLLNEIDARNNSYVSAVTQKLKYIVNSNKNSKKRLLTILKKYKGMDESQRNNFAEIVSQELNIHRQSYFDEGSLFVRGVSQRPEYSEPQEIDDTDDLPIPVLDPTEVLNNEFSPKSIIQNMEVLLHNKDEINLSDWKLTDSKELIKAILSTIRGHDYNVFYKAEVDKDKKVQNEKYVVPDTMFIRRRKL